MKVHTSLNPNVSVLRIFPGIPASIVEAYLKPPIRGIILETFGVGNCPTNREDLLGLFKDAAERDVIILNISQCARGSVENELYATGRFLSTFGIVGGADMTIECALAKLSFLLGLEPALPTTEIRRLLGQNLCGELSRLETL